MSLNMAQKINNNNNNKNNNSNNNNLEVCSVGSQQTEVLFDIHIVDTDIQLYLNRTPLDILSAAEDEKKSKYIKPVSIGEPNLYLCRWHNGKEASMFKEDWSLIPYSHYPSELY